MKKIVTFITVLVMITTCFVFVSCGQNDSEDSEELTRAKLALTNDLEALTRVCDDEPVTYQSHTYYTVKETKDGGHIFAGKIYFADRYGNMYHADYDANVTYGSWYPIINISEIKPRITWQ